MHVRTALPSSPTARSRTWRALLSLLLGILAGGLFICAMAHAQSSSTYPSGSALTTDARLAQQDQHGGSSYAGSNAASYAGSDYAWLPYTRRGYVGLNLGNSDYDTPCGPAPLSCDSRDRYVSVYTGGMFNDFLGLELGAKHFGTVDRAGGQVRAYGAALSLVGLAELENVSLYAKAGAIYARTRLSADPLAAIPTGTAKGWGPTMALGLGFNFNRNFTLALERGRDRIRLPGGSRAYVQSTSLALKYRF